MGWDKGEAMAVFEGDLSGRGLARYMRETIVTKGFGNEDKRAMIGATQCCIDLVTIIIALEDIARDF